MRFDFYGRKLRAVLSGADLRQYDLTYDDIDYNSPGTRFALLDILEEAHASVGYDPPGSRLYVEIYPYQDGCVVYFSGGEAGDEPPEAAPAAEAFLEPVVFTFSDCDGMLDACAHVFRQCCHRIFKSSLYYLDSRYRLIVYPLDNAQQDGLSIACLCEFAEPSGEGELLAAYVAEHGIPIAEENAIDKISYYLS